MYLNFFEGRSAMRWQRCGNAFGNSAQSLTKVAASAPRPLHSCAFKAATCRNMPQHAAAMFILNVQDAHFMMSNRALILSGFPSLILSLYLLSGCRSSSSCGQVSYVIGFHPFSSYVIVLCSATPFLSVLPGTDHSSKQELKLRL